MAGPIGVTFLLCERVLLEADNVPSAIRIVDVFYVRADESGDIVGGDVYFTMFCALKFDKLDESPHSFQVDIVFPDGRRERLLESEDAVTPPISPEDSARGANVIARLVLRAKMLGLHRLVAVVDGTDAATLPFTLIARAGPSEEVGNVSGER